MAKVTVIEPTKDTSLVRKLRCAAYCRVSSASEDQLHSYSAQVKYYGEKFKDSESEELVDIYADEGITGTCQDKREEFQRLMKDCRRGKIDRIYTKSISRFSRNTKDCLQSIRELKNLGISVYFEKENIDTAEISDEMMITIMGGLAQEESTSISQNMRWSIKKRMESGTFEASSIPYGYDKINGKLIENKSESEIVKLIYEMYLNGCGVLQILLYLNEHNVKTKTGKTKWSISSVIYILSNEKYVGDTLLQKKFTTNTMHARSLVNRGECPQYYIKDTHQAIIERESFDKVQTVMSERSSKIKQKEKKKNVFSAILKCGKCQSSYRRKKVNGIYYYVCKKHDKKADFCPSKPIPEESIRQAFVRLCNKLLLHYKEILLPMQKTLRELNTKRFSGNAKVFELRKEIAEIREQKHIISRLHTKGFIDEQKFVEQTTSLENRIEKLKRELNKISRSDNEDETSEQLDMLIDIFENRSEIFTEFEEDIFSQIVEKITVDDNTLKFELMSGLKFGEKI